ncbi:MAG: TonB-dependent receptor [Acidobacteriia bacterium]|nr:TonB-dependent receptor [Terriglobia bacterium]
MRFRTQRNLVLLGLAAACLLVSAMVLGQAATGALTGTFTDGKAPLPGVGVTVTNPATGYSRTTLTDADGNFRFRALPVGTYTLKADLAGFASVTAESVEVVIASERKLDVTMRSSKIAEQVTVTAEAPLVETTPSIGTVVSQNELQSLPLNGRQFANLGVLAPGTMLAYNTDPTKPGYLVIELNGGSGRNVNYIMDGGDNTDDTIGGALQNFNLESVQEFKIQTMQYKAEYGASSGGVLTVISKGGTNEFAGSAWEFARRTAWNSETTSEKAAGTGKNTYNRDQYGASLGGPIVKDKVHFFATFEKTKVDQSYIVDSGGIVPSLDGKSFPIPSDDNLITAKVTWDVDAQNYLQVRYGYQKNDAKYGQGSLYAPSNLGTSANKTSSILAGWTAQISSDKLNEFIFQYSKFNNLISADSNDPLLYYPSGFSIGQNIYLPQATNQVKYQYKDDFSFSKTIGRSTHDFKTGLMFVNEPTLNGNLTSGLSGQYSMIPGPEDGPAWVVGDVTKYGGFNGQSTPTKQYSAYFQDDWKVSPNLTVNLGLRYDYYDALTLNQSTSALWQMLSTQTTYSYKEYQPFKTSNPTLKNDKNDWSPRLGFSWDMNGDGKNIVRGGLGRFYAFPYINSTILWAAGVVQSHYGIIYEVADANGIKNPDGSYFQPGQPLPDCTLYEGATCGLGASQPFDVASPNLKPPHTDQVSLGYSWQVSPAVGLTFDAVKVKYYDLPYRVKANPYINATTRLFASLGVPGTFRIWTGDGFADYAGLNIGIHVRGEKFELQGFYTLSRATGSVLSGADEFRIKRSDYQPDAGGANKDQPFNPYNPTCSYCVGPLDTDARNRITLAGSYRFPYGFAVSGMFRYHDGTPYTIYGQGSLNTSLAPGVGHANSGNADAFSQLDLRVAKSFNFTKDLGLELYAEMFNVLNKKNPALYTSDGVPHGYAGDPGQGEQRLLQLGARFSF